MTKKVDSPYNSSVSDVYILGIESSCDETAAAVVRSGEELISNVVYSQFATHQPYGGVVPELASREHLRAIVPVVRKALDDAGKSYETIDAIAVTKGPGAGRSRCWSGLSYAKALAYARGEAAHRSQSSGRTHPRRAAGGAAEGQPRVGISRARAGGERRAHSSLSRRAHRQTAGCTTMWDIRATMRPARLSTRSPSCWNSGIPAGR